MISLDTKLYRGAAVLVILGFFYFYWYSNRGELTDTVDREWIGYYRTTKEWGGDDEHSEEVVIYADRILMRHGTYDRISKWKEFWVESSTVYPDSLSINLPEGAGLHMRQPQPGHYLMSVKEVYNGGDSVDSRGPYPMVKLRKGND
jgi:hypothetical protein